ncbi:MAG TPA: CDP-archaeol synthase [Candidatus Saccharimonadales bacterium]
MLNDILFALWFFLPAALANMIPIPLAKVSWLQKYDTPMDLGMKYRGKRVFGAHKTWRGFIAGIIIATITLWLQQLAVQNFAWAEWLTAQVDYVNLPTLIMGPLFAIGALGGDAIESFFKRQRGTAPGHGWFPWDQLDYIIGASLLTAPLVALTIWQYAWLIALWFLIHLLSTYIGWLIGLKERPI